MIGVSGNRGFSGIPFIALLEELSPRKNRLRLEGFSWSGVLINSHSKAPLLEENNVWLQQGETETVKFYRETKAPAGRTTPLRKPGFTGRGLCGGCNLLKERKARSIY